MHRTKDQETNTISVVRHRDGRTSVVCGNWILKRIELDKSVTPVSYSRAPAPMRIACDKVLEALQS